MKRTLVLCLLTALIGGCVVAPYGYRDGYYRDRGYYRGYDHPHGYYGGGYSYRDREHGS